MRPIAESADWAIAFAADMRGDRTAAFAGRPSIHALKGIPMVTPTVQLLPPDAPLFIRAQWDFWYAMLQRPEFAGTVQRQAQIGKGLGHFTAHIKNARRVTCTAQ